jgi:hypothetical protein
MGRWALIRPMRLSFIRCLLMTYWHVINVIIPNQLMIDGDSYTYLY